MINQAKNDQNPANPDLPTKPAPASSLDLNTIELPADLRRHINSTYYQILKAVPNIPKAITIVLPSPSSLMRLFPSWKGDPGAHSRTVQSALSSHRLAKESGDPKAIKANEDVLAFLTSSNDLITAPTAAFLTLLDPIGALYSQFTKRKTLGGMNLFNQNLEADRLYNEKSTFTKVCKGVGYASAVVTWAVVPQWAAVAAASFAAFDVLMQTINRKDPRAHSFRSGNAPIY